MLFAMVSLAVGLACNSPGLARHRCPVIFTDPNRSFSVTYSRSKSPTLAPATEVAIDGMDTKKANPVPPSEAT